MTWLKRAGWGLLLLFSFGAGAYWWLLVESHADRAQGYGIDLGEVRRLADSRPGEKPQSVRIETIARFPAVPRTFAVAGGGWQGTDLPVSAYELVYPDRVAVVDTAFSAPVAKAMTATMFDSGAYSRLSNALARAFLIVLTHEHPDHVGGLLAQPQLKQLLRSALLTSEQVRELEADLKSAPFDALPLSRSIFDGYRPIHYERYLAVAPGIVLIKSPGHTPGSQMVYVRRADGVEFLFVGDVAWQMEGIESAREKARLASWLSAENRAEVRSEVAALNRLHAAHPELHMMPGHDGAVIDSFVRSGLLLRGFEVPSEAR